MTENIERFPYKKENTNRLNIQKRKLPCQVSARWLQFPEESSRHPEGDYISVDVMTSTSTDNLEEKESKICELVLFREDIEAMLAACKPKS